MMTKPSTITVLGSVNLDLAANVHRLPLPGETITGATLRQFPGGKGANQALAAKRLGANVSLVARVGNDSNAELALRLLREGGVDLTRCRRVNDTSTGIALICIDADGENQIVVAPGANREFDLGALELPVADALICQLEVPLDVLCLAAQLFTGFLCINLAPACEVPYVLLKRADLMIVNQTEAAFYGASLHATDAIVVTTLGAAGAVAHQRGKVIAQVSSPSVTVVDTTGAGDAFTAALVVRLMGGYSLEDTLKFACVAGALATTKAGAQPSLPMLADVLAAC